METFDMLPPVHHPLLLTSNEKTGDLSLDKKQGHLFAQWPLATPGHTFTFLHSSTPKQQGSNTWCQAHPPPLYLCRGGGRAHHHHSTFTPPPVRSYWSLHLHLPLPPPSSVIVIPVTHCTQHCTTTAPQQSYLVVLLHYSQA